MTEADIDALSKLLEYLEADHRLGTHTLAKLLLARGVTIQHQRPERAASQWDERKDPTSPF